MNNDLINYLLKYIFSIFKNCYEEDSDDEDSDDEDYENIEFKSEDDFSFEFVNIEI